VIQFQRACILALVVLTLFTLWAGEPVPTGAPGVPNFHQVNDHIYRGAQPTPEGFKSLATIGVRTIIDLRSGKELRREEQYIVEKEGMHYVHIPLAGMAAPSDQQIATAFAVLNDPTAWPVFVHCRRGADRTGTVIACYRIAHDHWENEKALREARMQGMSRIEHAMQEYVLHFQTPPLESKISSN
jgi:tyrosine-protein phosphatase SIW14